MQVAIRDATLLFAEFSSIPEGLKALGLDSVEIDFRRDGKLPPLPREIRVCALLLMNDFSAPDLNAEIDWVIRGATAAKNVGAPVIRVDAIMKNAIDWPLEKRIARFTECMKRVLATPDARDIDFGIENHGPLGNDPMFLDAVLDSAGDPRLGLTLDTGNFYWWGKPLDEVHRVLEHFAPRTKHTHIKTIAYPADIRQQQREIGWRYKDFCCALPDGDIDLRRVVRALRAADYDRALCIENESLHRYSAVDRQKILLREADHLRQIIQETTP